MTIKFDLNSSSRMRPENKNLFEVVLQETTDYCGLSVHNQHHNMYPPPIGTHANLTTLQGKLALHNALYCDQSLKYPLFFIPKHIQQYN